MFRFKTRLSAHEMYAFAIVGMIIDHVGFYFAPDMLWLRVLRFCLFIWLIPIGYNIGRRPSLLMWQGVVLLAVMDLAAQFNPFPLSVLATMIAARYLVPDLMDILTRGKILFWAGQAVLIALIPVTYGISDYGTLGIMAVMGGWILRDREAPPDAPRAGRYVPSVPLYFSLLWLTAVITEQCTFEFSSAQLAFVCVSCALMLVQMTQLRQMLLNDLKMRSKDIVSRICQIVGHRTLEIYIIHRMLFVAAYIF